jgi:hypothetical protein
MSRAMIVTKGMFTSSGRLAMCRTIAATWATSITGSARICHRPAARRREIAGHLGQGIADVDLAAGDVKGAAVKAEGRVRPVTACFDMV